MNLTEQGGLICDVAADQFTEHRYGARSTVEMPCCHQTADCAMALRGRQIAVEVFQCPSQCVMPVLFGLIQWFAPVRQSS